MRCAGIVLGGSAGGMSLPEVLIHCSHQRGGLVAKLGEREMARRGRHLDRCKYIKGRESQKLLQRPDPSDLSLMHACKFVYWNKTC